MPASLRNMPRRHDDDPARHQRLPRSGLGARFLSQRRDDRLAPPRHRHGERRGARRGHGPRSARSASFPSREGDQERHHRDREDLRTTGSSTCRAASSAASPACSRGSPGNHRWSNHPRRARDWKRMRRPCRQRSTGIPAFRGPVQWFTGWLGVDCPSVRSAIWMMRALVAGNVLSRREGTTLFVPVNHGTDPGGVRVARALACAHRLAAARNIH